MYSDNEYKKDLIIGMNALVISMNDEDAYYKWIEVVPDQCTEDDLIAISEDAELFDEVCKLFVQICKYYLRFGLYICDKLYL